MSSEQADRDQGQGWLQSQEAGMEQFTVAGLQLRAGGLGQACQVLGSTPTLGRENS